MSINESEIQRRIDGIERRADIKKAAIEDRKKTVLELLAAGMCRKQIAAHLGIHQRDVSYYVQSMKKKSGAKNDFQLGLWAAGQGLV